MNQALTCEAAPAVVKAARAATARPGRGVGGGRQVVAIALREFGDRLRSGWVIACMVVWLGAIGLTSVFGLLQVGRIGFQGYERTVISLLNLVQYLVPLLGLLLGHDLIAGEVEERTFRLMAAAGVSRARLLLGKFFGGALALAVPVALGFAIAGTSIGFAARDASFGPFLRLASTGLLLGIIFVAAGLALSTFSRTRVQALVLALLAWCLAVFVFDLIALGVLVSAKSPAAAQEIEVVCDAVHVNAAAEIHTAFDNEANGAVRATTVDRGGSLGWLALNPIDCFRALNLPSQLGIRVSVPAVSLSAGAWIIVMLGAGLWRLRRIDF